MTSIIITGIAGRMGRSILEVARDQKVAIAGATEYPKSPEIGGDVGELFLGSRLNVKISDSLDQDWKGNPVVIDFTNPQATLAHGAIAEKKGIPMVIGTTGLSKDDVALLKKASKKIAIVFSPNMSVGVHTLFKLVSETVRMLGEGFDIEILEAHHRLKKDAPSGTAVKIAEILASATGRSYPKDFNFHREGLVGERSKKEIGMQVIRGGDIVGEHTVFFCGEGERVEIRHVATSRKTFAMGAVRAALWVSNKKPGLYSMNDVLGG